MSKDWVSNASRLLWKVMRSFGWTPRDEEVKDMVNVIDQVVNTYPYLLHNLFDGS